MSKATLYGLTVTVVSGVHVDPPVGERSNRTFPTPAPASVLVAAKVVLPRSTAVGVGAVMVTVGAMLSVANVNDDVAMLPAASVAVTVYAPGVDAPTTHEIGDDTNGPPGGAFTVSAECVQPVVAIVGNVAETADDPLTVATTVMFPVAVERNSTVEPVRTAPLLLAPKLKVTVGAMLVT